MPLTVYEENLIAKIPSILERIQAVEDYLASASLDHTHSNLSILDALTDAGSGIVISDAERLKIGEVDNKLEISDFNLHIGDTDIHHTHANKDVLDLFDTTLKLTYDTAVTDLSDHIANLDIHYQHTPEELETLDSFETGEDANGKYVRFGNIQICWGSITLPVNNVEPFGVVVGLTLQNMPISFSETPKIMMSCSSANDSNQYYQFGIKPEADKFEFLIRNSHNSALPSQTLQIYWIAIGTF